MSISPTATSYALPTSVPVAPVHGMPTNGKRGPEANALTHVGNWLEDTFGTNAVHAGVGGGFLIGGGIGMLVFDGRGLVVGGLVAAAYGYLSVALPR